MSNKITTQLVIEGKNSAGAAIKQATDQLGGLGGAAKKAGAYLLGALAVGSFGGFIKDSIDAADAANKAAQSTGLAVDQYTALKYAAGLADIDVGKLDSSLGKFNKTIDQAANGEKKPSEAFARLGISVRDAGGEVKSNQQLFAEVADVFQQMPDGVQKSALAMQLFGKSGAALIPLLNAGSSGLADMRKQAEDLGLVLSSKQTADAEAFNDNLSILGQVADGAANKISGALLPSLTDLTGLMLDLNQNTEAGGILADVLGGALKILATIVLYVGTGFALLGNTIGGAAAAAVQAAQGNFSAAAQIMSDIDRDNTATAAAAEARIKGLWDGTLAATATGTAGLKNAYEKNLSDQDNYVKATEANNKKLQADAKKASAALLSEQKKAQTELKKLQDEKLSIAAKYDASKAGAGGAVDPTYGNAQQLKVNAAAALRSGDVAGAKSLADQSLKVIEALEAAGGNTYGLRGFKDELQGIEQAAADIQINEKAAEVTALAYQIADLEAKAKAVNDALQLKPTLDPAAAAELQSAMQKLAAALGQTLTIPVRVVPVYPEGVAPAASGRDPDVPYVDGYASGTNNATRGIHWVGENGPELLAFGGGEKVFTAAASNSLMSKIQGMQMPAQRDGSMVSAAMSAPVGPSSIGTVNLNLDGKNYPMTTDSQNFAELVKREKWKRGRS